jgi:hypothetical protein
VASATWPALPLGEWQETYATLHRWAQIVGKIQLALTPRTNHFWNVAFTVTPRGLSTGSIPMGDQHSFSIDLDLLDHNLVVRTSRKETRALALAPRTVADFYRELLSIVATLGIDPAIHDHPVEILEGTVPFADDRQHAAYEAAWVERLFGIIAHSAAILEEFRARFVGKASPVQFYWGSFDLAASRFSGRPAPPRPGADVITRVAYSHEVYSCGFWPGDVRFPEAAYYAYIAPAPAGFSTATVRPSAARWNPQLGEYLLPYEAVRSGEDPRAVLLEFFQSTYDAAADLARWDRAALEAQPGAPYVELPAHPPSIH